MGQQINVEITTLNANEELLLNDKIKTVIKNLGKMSEQEYKQMVQTGIRMSFDIFTSDTKITINGVESGLIENAVYSSGGDFLVKSIKIEKANTTLVFSFKI